MTEGREKNKRQLQKEETRKLILMIAMEQFAQNGFAATTTAVIASEAKVSHGTIFAHFKTQEELVNAVIEEFGENLNRRLHELAAGEKSLREVLAAHLAGLSESERFYSRLVIESRLLSKTARRTLVRIQSTISHHINQAAEKEREKGTILSCPAHLLFNTWNGLIHYYLANDDLFAPEGSVLQRYGTELLEHYLSLLSVKE